MIISNSKKFIFVHLHKCAGSNITRTLSSVLEWNDIECGGTKLGESIQEHYGEKYGIQKHSRAYEIREVVGDEIWNDYFTFAFVRNPYSRAVSLYTFVKQLIDIKTKGVKKFTRLISRSREGQFWSWPLTRACLESGTFSDFIRHEDFASSVGSQPQYLSVSSKDGSEVIVDYIGKVECMKQDFDEVLKRIGIDGISLGVERSSNKKSGFHEYYAGKEDYRIITEMFEKDFECLGYGRKL